MYFNQFTITIQIVVDRATGLAGFARKCHHAIVEVGEEGAVGTGSPLLSRTAYTP
jgi:hypothetical protein